jgi:hypothetical protein
MRNLYLIKTVRCAHCGQSTEEANHWFVLTVRSGKFRCRPLASKATVISPVPSSRIAALRLLRSEEPVCGQQCAQKLFERYLTGEMNHRTMRTP